MTADLRELESVGYRLTVTRAEGTRHMLMLTPNAVEAVRTITSAQDAPENAGLRISTTDGAETLQLAIVGEPRDDDEVLTAEGSRIYLDQQAAAFLDDKILDTGLDPDGQGAFILAQQERKTD
ncbi:MULTISPECIES: iron-sulfur cluster biosynthesis family protein [unclassified Nocardia]|uniref:iron-sulfur cluster biosynthesis family protein n=1 Tax=unclassified Nocardia TaxID=2637762 RepID=UPI001CE401E9|nr:MULTISPECIES: iron-sulfur cluster biosynthesis family protein [unclassified Nocardia]